MTLQRVLSYVRRAVDDYHMIEDGDHIAVGISGGKDSLTLLYGLNGLMRFYPERFTIHAVTVDLASNLNLENSIPLPGIEYRLYDSENRYCRYYL